MTSANTLHARLRTQRGPASQHECARHCGNPASDWAQIHDKSGEDIWSDYVPLCRSCHQRYDSTGAQGHGISDWPPVNREVAARRRAAERQALKEAGLLRESYTRLDGGQPLRDAMKRGGWKLQTLAAATKEIDPTGKGVSFQLIAFLATPRRWGRDTTSARTVDLLSRALDVPESELFVPTVTPMPEDST